MQSKNKNNECVRLGEVSENGSPSVTIVCVLTIEKLTENERYANMAKMDVLTKMPAPREASTLADLADGRRWIVAHQALEAGSRMQWWWYIGSEDAALFQKGRDKGIFGSAQRRTAEGYELIGWQAPQARKAP